MNKFYNISRIDSGNTHGWFVRVSIDSEMKSKLFSDLKHKGKELALENAITYRDELYKIREAKKREGNVSVRLFKEKQSKKGKVYDHDVYKVEIKYRSSLGNSKRYKCFSTKKYGDEKARQKARAYMNAVMKKYGIEKTNKH
jgi:hypothetical protein